MHALLLLGLSLITSSNAAANPAAVCSVVNKAVTLAKQQSAATAFCASYLKLKTSASTSTVTASTSTTSITITTGTTTSTTTVATCPAPKAPAMVRAVNDARAASKPSCLGPYSSGGPLSSACSCLKIPTATVTTTTTTPVTVESTTVPAATATATALAPPPCTDITFPEQIGILRYYLYDAGCGKVRTTPGKFALQRDTAGNSLCTFIRDCAIATYPDNDSGYALAIYHVVVGGDHWQCYGYPTRDDTDNNDFTAPALVSSESYGYNFDGVGDGPSE